MTKEIIFQSFTFFGGFGMFIYGMHIMASGLQKSTDTKMKQLLDWLTSNRYLAVLVGALVTALIQSSSATTVMVVGFVNAGLMSLTQAVGIIMGANIGTTITAWIVSSSEWLAFLKPSQLAPLGIGVGAVLLFFSKDSRKKKIGEIIIGFGLIFIGLEFMKNAIEPYSDSPAFRNAFIVLGRNPIFGILAGALVTGIVQSSSASVGILQTLAMTGLVPWNAAVYIILGQNIGTTVTAMISSIGANKTARRAAVIHLIFNFIGSLLFAIGAFIFFGFINPTVGNQLLNSADISIFHTVFNIANTLILFPFANQLVQLSKWVVPGEDVSADDTDVTLFHLDDRLMETPSFAVESAIKEVVSMGEYTLGSVRKASLALQTGQPHYRAEVEEREKNINRYEQLITDYLIKLVNTAALNERQNFIIHNLLLSIGDLERLGDHAKDITELAIYYQENEVNFSEQAVNELQHIAQMVDNIVTMAIEVRQTMDSKLINKIEDLEEKIDILQEELRESHIERLTLGLCQGKAGIIFLDSVTHYERMSDHALKIAYYVKDELMF